MESKLNRTGKRAEDQVAITDRGQPAHVIRAVPMELRKTILLPDYYSRLLKRQPIPLPIDATHQFWAEERG